MKIRILFSYLLKNQGTPFDLNGKRNVTQNILSESQRAGRCVKKEVTENNLTVTDLKAYCDPIGLNVGQVLMFLPICSLEF